jgi:hypothetical protein
MFLAEPGSNSDVFIILVLFWYVNVIATDVIDMFLYIHGRPGLRQQEIVILLVSS